MASLKIKCAKSEKIFEIPKKSLRFSIPLTNYFLKNNLEAIYTLQNHEIEETTLSYFVNYLTHYENEDLPFIDEEEKLDVSNLQEIFPEWEYNFLSKIPLFEAFQLINIGEETKIENLKNLMIYFISSHLKGKTKEERDRELIFTISN